MVTESLSRYCAAETRKLECLMMWPVIEHQVIVTSLLRCSWVEGVGYSVSKCRPTEAVAGGVAHISGISVPIQQVSIDGVPAKTADDSAVTQPKEGLICMQWYQPLLDKLAPSPDTTDQCIIVLYALLTKSGRRLTGVRMINAKELHQIIGA